MSLQGILDILTERGLSLRVEADGKPHLRGPKCEITPALLDALSAHRDEIVAHFKSKSSRRIVLLKDGDVEKVLEECSPAGHQGRARLWAEKYPGREVAAEWCKRDDHGERWMRFLTIRFPMPENDVEKTTVAVSVE